MIVLEGDQSTTGDVVLPTTSSTSLPPGPMVTSTPGIDTFPESTGADSSTGSDFIVNIDAPLAFECDPFEQNCPPGEKCMPWANDGGGTWNATRCSPIADNPDGVGEPCMVDGGGTSGIDSCDGASMCFGVDPGTGLGICRAFCIGDVASPTCEDPDAVCPISGDGVLTLCFPTCNPLGEDCGPSEICIPWSGSDLFCTVDASGDMGAVGDPCEYINVCDNGNLCVPADAVPGCERSSGCCTAFCSVSDPDPPCLAGQGCVPYFERGGGPPELMDLGICAART